LPGHHTENNPQGVPFLRIARNDGEEKVVDSREEQRFENGPKIPDDGVTVALRYVPARKIAD
jgi:hypothetical protein